MSKISVSLSLSSELLDKIDIVRKLVPRSTYVESVLDDFFEKLKVEGEDENEDHSDPADSTAA
jgi:hypothetical protein